MSDEIKSCPFCGNAKPVLAEPYGGCWRYACDKCGSYQNFAPSVALAERNWNTRAESSELSKLRAEVEEIRHSNVTLRGAADLNGQLAVAERAARETAEKDSAFVRDKVREFGSTLGKWFPELHMPEQFALERGIHIARELIKARADLSTLREQNASQAQRIAELVALVGEMKPFVKELIEDVRHQAEILKQIPRAQFEMLEPVAKSLIARADAILSRQPATGPTDTERLEPFCESMIRQFDRLKETGQARFGTALLAVQSHEIESLRAAMKGDKQ